MSTPGTPIRFWHRGRTVEVADAPATRSVLDWLREDAHCTGTKEGCNEGDCGACTVVVGELPEHTDATDRAVRGLVLRSVNACLQFLPSLHGKALFTVEDLKPIAAPHALHPVQQAMVDCHGSQCGFCTPGFVMSMWREYETHHARGTRPTRRALADALSGNLCRCTGYRLILDAAERMFDANAVMLNTAPPIAALRDIASGPALQYMPIDGSAFHAPRSLTDLATLYERMPNATLVAGATDIGLWVTKQFRPLGPLIHLGSVAELKTVTTTLDELRIGAGVSLEEAWRALASHRPELCDVWLRFASPPIRHAGTLGGNVANGSPIGDGAPVLIALDASIELRRGEAVRRLPLSEFYVDYMKNRLEPGEFVQTLTVPLDSLQRTLRAYKISKRYDSDISAVLGAFSVTVDVGAVQEIRLTFGGMAAIVARAKHAEAAALDEPWSLSTIKAMQQALSVDFNPLTDMRASAGYRLRGAQNLLMRFWLETRAHNPLPPHATNVWHDLHPEP